MEGMEGSGNYNYHWPIHSSCRPKIDTDSAGNEGETNEVCLKKKKEADYPVDKNCRHSSFDKVNFILWTCYRGIIVIREIFISLQPYFPLKVTYLSPMVILFQQVRSSLQQRCLNSLATPAGGAAPPRGFQPKVTPSPATGCPSSLTSTRSAGPAGSSPPAVTTPTTARAPAHSHWGATSEPPTTPRYAPSCMR